MRVLKLLFRMMLPPDTSRRIPIIYQNIYILGRVILHKRQSMQDWRQEKLASKYFSRKYLGELFLLLTASGQMSIDQAVKYVCNFKTSQLRQEFMDNINLSCFESFPSMEEANKEFEKDIPQGRSLLQQLKQSLHSAVDRISEQGCSLLHTGLVKEARVAVNTAKIKWIANSKNAVKPHSIADVEYLKELIKSIIEKLFRESDEQVIDRIIHYGGIDSVITHQLFATDVFLRKRFNNILYNCKTFKWFKLYRGDDIGLRRAELVNALSECLVQLDFNEKVAESILNELLIRPLSNIVANRNDLTNQQKMSFYHSQFYTSGMLNKYAHILNYGESLEFRLKEEIGQILEVIEDHVRITREILDCILNIKIFDLLKLISIRPIGRIAFNFITRNCPDYFRAFKLAKYQGKALSSFGENEGDQLKMELINIFLDIRLPFEDWQLAQDKIMQRNYSVIDVLTLKLQGKHELMQQIISKIEPYFHQKEKVMDYRSEIELLLLQEIMATDISETTSFENMMVIIGQTLDSYNCSSESMREMLSIRNQVAYRSVLANSAFREYVANNRRDVKEQRYVERWQLFRHIYENNLQDKIDVKYEAIDEFIETVTQNKWEKNTLYHKHVTNMSKLRERFLRTTGVDIFPEQLEFQDKNPQQLIRMFNKQADILYKTYTARLEDSRLGYCCKTKFNQNVPNLVRKMIQQSVFTDENSTFFSDLGYSGHQKIKLKEEIWGEANYLAPEINRCMILLMNLNQKRSFQMISQSQFAKQVRCKTKYEVFVEKYISLNDESYFEKALKLKYQNDCISFVQVLKTENAFTNLHSSFFINLDWNVILTRRTKIEFERNANWVMQYLDEMP